MIKKITEQRAVDATKFDYTIISFRESSIMVYIDNNKCHVIYQFEDSYAKQENVPISSAFDKLHHYGPDAIKRYVDMAE